MFLTVKRFSIGITDINHLFIIRFEFENTWNAVTSLLKTEVTKILQGLSDLLRTGIS